MKLFAFIAVTVMGNPVLTFDRPVKKAVIDETVNKPQTGDFSKDYVSEDGNTKYHAEMHYLTDSNKDDFKGFGGSIQLMNQEFKPFGEFETELNKVYLLKISHLIFCAFRVDSRFVTNQ